jgi:hypothetical protein
MKTKASLIKKQALACSRLRRANKFTRVGADFLQQVEAEIDAHLRKLHASPDQLVVGELVEPVAILYTPDAKERILAAFNRLIAARVQSRVHSHPSIGKTLQG